MNKFVLFGDSYVDPLKVNAGECWSDLLARDAEVVNYGKSGTGPDYSLDLLENFIDKEFKGYEVVVFFIGFPCRFNFTGIPHPARLRLNSMCLNSNGAVVGLTVKLLK